MSQATTDFYGHMHHEPYDFFISYKCPTQLFCKRHVLRIVIFFFFGICEMIDPSKFMTIHTDDEVRF